MFCREMQSYSHDFTLQTLINVFKINVCRPEGYGWAEQWGHVNLLKLSWAKEKLLYLGRSNHKHKHRLGGESSPGEDLEAG